jgi:hypothetical protein
VPAQICETIAVAKNTATHPMLTNRFPCEDITLFEWKLLGKVS